ncbi:hypothetical protein AB0I89_33350 [Micromonospora sp. NPDC049801]|uniref:hypothetical protein n=1 Tax=Micromonospora sp. NPDC049801 TaxID=3155509 RepID=UPI0033C7D5CE
MDSPKIPYEIRDAAIAIDENRYAARVFRRRRRASSRPEGRRDHLAATYRGEVFAAHRFILFNLFG